ncbi:uncharacterized protein E0L32_011605 [Thyridium curvatum]|uniref:Zn(2)-C6 fungal-type domain-containing protein n=1 Tax=Thyridium curvatum TaxID=1093900 RepID=A0A507B840_9PEZI|nr:uncharacterized protein E0L32_011605 [Thyridium curvatum]TPX18492.1 hypothetical protein E0L32_011605 [Thyridium curvatum]
MDTDSSGPPRKRLRTSHACDVCRARKIRCNGENPCAACAVAEHECTYGSEANSRGKSDLILEGVLRVERFLHEINASLGAQALPTVFPERRLALPTACSSAESFSSSPCTDVTQRFPQPQQQRTPVSEVHQLNSLENAVLDSMHTSTTEYVLQWPHFDVFPSLRNDYISIFQLEQSRPGYQTSSVSSIPELTSDEMNDILLSFEHNINFSYPTMSQPQLEAARHILMSRAVDQPSQESCLALLTMALGCASRLTSDLVPNYASSQHHTRCQHLNYRELGDGYFNKALSQLHVAHTGITSTATQSLFFVAMYFAFLRRPLQAWEYINAAAAKCLLLLSYPPTRDEPEEQERIRRIFWSCYILESDYLAELSALPQSGIARIESSIPLPGEYHTHAAPDEEEQSSLYFLACISMRRLLNRVHQLLYARGTGASLDPSRFPYVVAELDHQLEEWRDVLPAAFHFSVDYEAAAAGPPASEHGGFLRQRYLTCRSVIYRPYLMWMLSGVGGTELGGCGSGFAVSGEVLKNCKTCLDACLLHILNLRGFAHTVLVDTWICSLS